MGRERGAPGTAGATIRLLRFFQRERLFAPLANAAIHGNNVGVTHLLQVVGGEGGAETATTIEDERGIEGGIPGLDVALDDAFAEVDGSREMVGIELAVFADVDQNKLFFSIEAGFDFVDGGFTDALLGVFNDFEETRGMIVSHDFLHENLNRVGGDLLWRRGTIFTTETQSH
jgi:hypothetical protein